MFSVFTLIEEVRKRLSDAAGISKVFTASRSQTAEKSDDLDGGMEVEGFCKDREIKW